MSELNRVIEERLAAAEAGATSAGTAASAAQTAADNAQSTADEADAKITVSGTEPSSPTLGQLWSDTGTNTLKLWNGAAWLTFATV